MSSKMFVSKLALGAKVPVLKTGGEVSGLGETTAVLKCRSRTVAVMGNAAETLPTFWTRKEMVTASPGVTVCKSGSAVR